MINPTPELPVLPYGTISPEFENLLTATVNKADREWPVRWKDLPGAKFIVESCARVTKNTHLSIRYLCADKPRPDWKVEFALSAGPMVRSLVDTVFLLVFLFEDVPQRHSWYLRSGFRESAEELARYKEEYSQNSDWQDWLTGFAQGVEEVRALAGVSMADSVNLEALNYWPTPGQMRKSKKLTPPDQTFLKHLDDWFYREFSSYTHLSLPGLVMRSSGLRPATEPEVERVRAWRVDKQRSDALASALLMSLAIMSEIDAACEFGLHTRLRYIWRVLAEFLGAAKNLYILRYDGLLPSAGT